MAQLKDLQDQGSYIVLMEDDIIHTQQQPFCSIDPNCPCHEDQTLSPLRPEWQPLDELAQAWASFGLQVTSALALQAVGSAFLALSCETSAHTHSTRAHHSLWRQVPLAVAQDLDHASTDLLEACRQWASATLWLERFANEEAGDEETLAAVRSLFVGSEAQQRRLWLLLERLQAEQRAGEKHPLVAHLGHLSSASVGTDQERREPREC